MNTLSTRLAALGALIAGPAFLLNFAWHGGTMPGPNEVDRADGAFSLMFMAGVSLIVAAMIDCRPSPVARKGRWLLYVESAMVALAAVWAGAVIVDPAYADSSNPLLLAGDASWPLHQALMLVIGIVAVRAGRWPSPARFALFAPTVGVVLVVTSSAVGADVVAAAAIGAGWAIVAAGVLTATSLRAGWRNSASHALSASVA